MSPIHILILAFLIPNVSLAYVMTVSDVRTYLVKVGIFIFYMIFFLCREQMHLILISCVSSEAPKRYYFTFVVIHSKYFYFPESNAIICHDLFSHELFLLSGFSRHVMDASRKSISTIKNIYILMLCTIEFFLIACYML